MDCNKMEIISEFVEENGSSVVRVNGFDDCVLGTIEKEDDLVLVYDSDKIIMKLINEGLSYEEAVEHYEYNIVGSWVGNQTPLYVRTYSLYCDEMSGGSTSKLGDDGKIVVIF